MAFTKISILYWNTQQKNVTQIAVRLVKHYAVNILLMTEVQLQMDAVGLLRALNQDPRLPGEHEFVHIDWEDQPKPRTAMSHLYVVTSLPESAWKQWVVRNRYAIWALTLPGYRQFQLVATHLPSIQQDQGDVQRESAIALRSDLERLEQGSVAQDNPLSVIIGDMNANPFDAGIVSVYGLNATHLKDIAARQVRNANGKLHQYLFNPMWRFLGTDPWGTYYNDKLSNPIRYDWAILDQVLVRPEVIHYFDRGPDPDICIPTTDGTVDLNPSNDNEDSDLPDHRPLWFRFYLPSAPGSTGAP